MHILEIENHSELHIKATYVRVNNGNNDLTATAFYYPPQGDADGIKLMVFFLKLGDRFIVGGDYNANHFH